MKLNSSISGSSIFRYLTDVSGVFANYGWIMGDLGSQSIILNDADIEAYFLDEFNPSIVKLKHAYPSLKNRFILVTMDGIPIRNIGLWKWKLHKMCGIVRITPDGKGYSIMWGMKNGQPTKRFEEHLAIHNASLARDSSHVAVCFASPSSTQQLSYSFKEDNQEKYSYLLWNCYPDLARLAPQGLGYAPKLVDLEPNLWTVLSEKFQHYNAFILQYQGLFVASSGWDGVMALTEAIERAAQNALTLGFDQAIVLESDFFTRMAEPLKLKLNQNVLAYGKVNENNGKTNEH